MHPARQDSPRGPATAGTMWRDSRLSSSRDCTARSALYRAVWDTVPYGTSCRCVPVPARMCASHGVDVRESGRRCGGVGRASARSTPTCKQPPRRLCRCDAAVPAQTCGSPGADVAAFSRLHKPPAHAPATRKEPSCSGMRNGSAAPRRRPRGMGALRTSTELKWRSPTRTEKNVDSPLCATSTVPCARPGADVGAAKSPDEDVAKSPGEDAADDRQTNKQTNESTTPTQTDTSTLKYGVLPASGCSTTFSSVRISADESSAVNRVTRVLVVVSVTCLDSPLLYRRRLFVCPFVNRHPAPAASVPCSRPLQASLLVPPRRARYTLGRTVPRCTRTRGQPEMHR